MTRSEKKAILFSVVSMVVVVIGASALLWPGLSWPGFFGALAVALYASAVVVAAIVFHSAYHRLNARPPEPVYQIEEPLAPSEGLDEPFGTPEQPEWTGEERPQP